MKNKIKITIINKKTGEIIQNRLAWAMQGDPNELDNLIKELQEVRKFVNGEVNRMGLALKEVTTEIEFFNQMVIS